MHFFCKNREIGVYFNDKRIPYYNMINIKNIKPKIKGLAEEFNLSLVVLFGSQASGKTHSKSDIDFAFLSDRNMSLREIAQMQFDFCKKLKLQDLELVDLKKAPPLLLKQVAQKSILLYEKKPLVFNNFNIYAIKRFMEAKKLLDLRKLSFNKFLQTI